MASYIGRRELLAALGGAAAAWPLAARAQTKRARICWFTVAPHPYIDGFRQGLRELGWIEGENVASNLSMRTVILSGCPGWPRYWRASPTIWSWLRVPTPSKRRVRQFNRFL